MTQAQSLRTTAVFVLAIQTLAGLAKAAQEGADGWILLVPERVTSEGGATLSKQPDGSILVAGANPDGDVFVVEAITDLRAISGIRLEALPDPSLPKGGPGRAHNGNFVLSELELTAGTKLGGAARPVQLVNGTSSFAQHGWPSNAASDGLDTTGWAILPRAGTASSAVFETTADLGYPYGTRLVFKLIFRFGTQHVLGRFRFSATQAPRPLRADRDGDVWAGLQVKINTAIDRGLAYLLSEQELDGSWAGHQPQYRNGQTALSLYALVKSGVPPRHQAVQRALAYLRAVPPRETYSMGCQLMAMTALEDPSLETTIRELAQQLVAWQRDRGGFAYPGGAIDLSNTQYGALGMRAAARFGVKIPQEEWQELAQRVVLHQEKNDNPYGPAGFGYHNGGGANGSLTAAGVGVLAICEEQLGRLTPEATQAKRAGIEWLNNFFSATSNPKSNSDVWIFYYLYGIERVGGLTNIAEFGNVDWYKEGARYLVEGQADEGSWSTSGGGKQENTSFGLLFLSKATASPTTGSEVTRGARTYGKDDPESPVSLRASGDTPLTVWVSSFGQQTREECEWPGEEGKGLHVRQVDYVRPGRQIITDARTRSSTWRYTFDEPPLDWSRLDFDDGRWKRGPGAFGMARSPGTVVGTEWRSEAIWMRHEFRVEPESLVDPVLLLHCSDDPPLDAGRLSGPPLVCLYDEGSDFAFALDRTEGGSRISEQDRDVHHGQKALEVTPVQRHSARVEGWSFRITDQPREGEYRYVRFAWKKVGGGGNMIQLAMNGAFGAQTVRYVAGANEVNWEPSIKIDRADPAKWTVVTRDLYKDLGSDAILTGLALTPMSGSAGFYDAIYLARTEGDFRNIPKMIRLELDVAGGNGAALEPYPGETVEIHLNGERIYEGSPITRGYEVVPLDRPLRGLLRPGRNLIAVRCHRTGIGSGQALDVGIRDFQVLASSPWNDIDPAGLARFPSQITFERPGNYEIMARVQISLAPTDGESVETKVIESTPVQVTIEEVLDPELLTYAGDAGRNLLAGVPIEAKASSETSGWTAVQAADNLLARAWLSGDGDPQPSIRIDISRPVRATRILLTPTRNDRLDRERTTKIRRVELLLNGKGPAEIIEMSPDPLRKTAHELKKPVVIRRIDLRVLERTPGHPQKDAVGFAEIELQGR